MRDCIPKLSLVRAIMKLVKNIVEGVKFTLFHEHILVTDDSNKGKDFHTCSSLPSVFIANAYFFLLLPLLHLYIV